MNAVMPWCHFSWESPSKCIHKWIKSWSFISFIRKDDLSCPLFALHMLSLTCWVTGLLLFCCWKNVSIIFSQNCVSLGSCKRGCMHLEPSISKLQNWIFSQFVFQSFSCTHWASQVLDHDFHMHVQKTPPSNVHDDDSMGASSPYIQAHLLLRLYKDVQNVMNMCILHEIWGQTGAFAKSCSILP